MSELVILRGYYSGIGDLIEATRFTEARVYYVSGRRETFTDLKRVLVRNATPELHVELQRIWREYEAEKSASIKDLKNECDLNCRAAAKAHGCEIKI